MQTNKYNSRDIGKKFDVTVDSKPVQNEGANLPPTIVADISMVHMLFLDVSIPTCMFSFGCIYVTQILCFVYRIRWTKTSKTSWEIRHGYTQQTSTK